MVTRSRLESPLRKAAKPMSKQQKVAERKRKENDEAMKNVAIKRSKEEQCRLGLMDYLDETLTVEQTAKLMKDVDDIKVHSLWEDRWRVDIWSKTPCGEISFKNKIKASFFIVWDNQDGVGYINPNPVDLINRDFKTNGKIFS